jgi:hypothetical protein
MMCFDDQYAKMRAMEECMLRGLDETKDGSLTTTPTMRSSATPFFPWHTRQKFDCDEMVTMTIHDVKIYCRRDDHAEDAIDASYYSVSLRDDPFMVVGPVGLFSSVLFQSSAHPFFVSPWSLFLNFKF